MGFEQLISAPDPAPPLDRVLASADSNEAVRRNWDRTSQRIVKAAQGEIASERAAPDARDGARD
jgi:hypothetical protein